MLNVLQLPDEMLGHISSFENQNLKRYCLHLHDVHTDEKKELNICNNSNFNCICFTGTMHYMFTPRCITCGHDHVSYGSGLNLGSLAMKYVLFRRLKAVHTEDRNFIHGHQNKVLEKRHRKSACFVCKKSRNECYNRFDGPWDDMFYDMFHKEILGEQCRCEIYIGETCMKEMIENDNEDCPRCGGGLYSYFGFMREFYEEFENENLESDTEEQTN